MFVYLCICVFVSYCNCLKQIRFSLKEIHLSLEWARGEKSSLTYIRTERCFLRSESTWEQAEVEVEIGKALLRQAVARKSLLASQRRCNVATGAPYIYFNDGNQPHGLARPRSPPELAPSVHKGLG